MTRSALVLYGPPASGKDTITAALTQRRRDYVLFERLKVGGEPTRGYRPATLVDIKQLRDRGLLLYENERYGNLYAVDRPMLDALLDRGSVPVVHVGQIEGVRALRRHPIEWLAVLLWCPRRIAELRARDRGSNDLAARLAAWDETERDLVQCRPDDFSLRIDTEVETPTGAAERIHAEFLKRSQER